MLSPGSAGPAATTVLLSNFILTSRPVSAPGPSDNSLDPTSGRHRPFASLSRPSNELALCRPLALRGQAQRRRHPPDSRYVALLDVYYAPVMEERLF
jgi:hypothetical protein